MVAGPRSNETQRKLIQDFDSLLSLAEQGDHRNVDMLVKDIYGADYTKFGLPADLIASSFGNIIKVILVQLRSGLIFTISVEQCRGQ